MLAIFTLRSCMAVLALALLIVCSFFHLVVNQENEHTSVLLEDAPLLTASIDYHLDNIPNEYCAARPEQYQPEEMQV